MENNTLDLSYACLDAKPIDYEFSGTNWDNDNEDGSGWRICYGTILSNDQPLSIPGDKKSKTTLELNPTNFEITIWDSSRYCDEILAPADDGYAVLASKFGLDGDEVRRFLDHEDDDDWHPQMNFAYPLDREPPDDWKTRVTNCTCVRIDGAYYLALTGGGMDFSWEICESYLCLGYFPPAHFADLPAMAGRGKNERDKWIVEGCRCSLHGMLDRVKRALIRLDDLTID